MHPDKNSQPDATSKFIELIEAHEVLSDKERRQYYDQLLDQEETHIAIDQQKRNLWEDEVKLASSKGKKRGEKYARNFDYFSKEVIGSTLLMIAFDLGLGMIFGEITSLLTFSFLMTIIGIVITIINFHNYGIVIGLLITIISGLIFRWRVRRESIRND